MSFLSLKSQQVLNSCMKMHQLLRKLHMQVFHMAWLCLTIDTPQFMPKVLLVRTASKGLQLTLSKFLAQWLGDIRVLLLC